ncbi:MAG: c-type cytochrome, partial [Burkholderiaceae bacterium]
MSGQRVVAWSNPWFRWSVISFCASSVAAILIGFIWLPSAQGDFSAQGLWASICRAAGVPARWSEAPQATASGARSTSVVLNEAMAKRGSDVAVGRGATLA